MTELRFTHNWNNKLHCKAFTSIRLSNRFKPGQEYKITLQKTKNDIEPMGIAKVIAVKEFYLKDLNEFMAYLDTGYSVEETKKIIHRMNQKFKVDYSKQKLCFILFNYLNSKELTANSITDQINNIDEPELNTNENTEIETESKE